MYAHGGSGNHGCEAIVDSLCTGLSQRGIPADSITVLSNSSEEDREYGLDRKCRIIRERSVNSSFITHSALYMQRALTRDDELFLKYRYAPAMDRDYDLAVSIGGDNYCYPSMVPDLIRGNLMWKNKGVKTMLAGCSIEPELLKGEGAGALIDDLKRYDAVTARESVTYNALRDAGITRLYRFPDPAFTLRPEREPLPEGFLHGNTLGVNLSEMAMEDGTDKLFPAVLTVLKYVLKETDMNICMIPHVVWKNNDDRRPLKKLYDELGDPGRVIMLPDHSARVQKGFISRLRMFMGARTHSVIAAYSEGVPTLALGYSVKASAIAKDIFGKEENFVVPVQMVNDSDDILKEFQKLLDQENGVRTFLSDQMPDYIKMAAGTADVMAAILGGSHG